MPSPPVVLTIPDEDCVARFCPPGSIDTEGRITAAAFELRKIDDGRLSVQWEQCHSGKAALVAQLAAVKGYAPTGRIGYLQSGEIRKIGPQVVHRPGKGAKKCHASIVVEGAGLTLEREIVADLLAELANLRAERVG
jgi:hypothetical protein